MKNLSFFFPLLVSGIVLGQVENAPNKIATQPDQETVQTSPAAADDAQVQNVVVSRFGLLNTNYVVGATIKNVGNNAIQTLELKWSDGTNEQTCTLTNVNLFANQSRLMNHTIPLNYPVMSDKNITVTVTAVNSNPDSDPSNNSATGYFTTVSQASTKRVVIEEGTGTWCGWCPRGFVAMDNANNAYPNNFVGIAVHMASYDPMIVPAYSAGTGITSFPSMNVDRILKQVGVTADGMSTYVQNRMDIVAPAELNASGGLIGNNLYFNASATFRANMSNANLRFAVVLTEDNIQGNNSNYSQRNYYANNAAGPMAGWENRPDPYPYTVMVYDHVARMLLGGYAGQAGSIPATITDGQTVNYEFTTSIPTNYNPSNMTAVLLLLDATTGAVMNGRSFVLGTLGTTNVETNKNYLAVYPNPASEYFKVQSDHPVDVAVYDTSGKMVLSQSNVLTNTEIHINKLPKGVYLVRMAEKGNGKNTKSQKLIIK